MSKNKKWWDAKVYIAKYAAPKIYKLWQNCNSYPHGLNSVDEWRAELAQMYAALKCIADDEYCEVPPWVQAGLELFGKRFTHLWD